MNLVICLTTSEQHHMMWGVYINPVSSRTRARYILCIFYMYVRMYIYIVLSIIKIIIINNALAVYSNNSRHTCDYTEFVAWTCWELTNNNKGWVGDVVLESIFLVLHSHTYSRAIVISNYLSYSRTIRSDGNFKFHISVCTRKQTHTDAHALVASYNNK